MLLANSEDPADAAFHQGLHSLLRLKYSLGTEVHHNLENSTCDLLGYTMGSPILIVSICMGKSIRIQRVNKIQINGLSFWCVYLAAVRPTATEVSEFWVCLITSSALSNISPFPAYMATTETIRRLQSICSSVSEPGDHKSYGKCSKILNTFFCSQIIC